MKITLSNAVGVLIISCASLAVAAPPPPPAPAVPPGGMIGPGGVGGQMRASPVGGTFAATPNSMLLGPSGSAFTNGIPGGQLYVNSTRVPITRPPFIIPPGGVLSNYGFGWTPSVIVGGGTNGSPGGMLNGNGFGVIVAGGNPPTPSTPPGGAISAGTGGTFTNGSGGRLNSTAAPSRSVIVTGGQ
jgi:hypothetical protein